MLTNPTIMERVQWMVLAVSAAGILSACGGNDDQPGQPQVAVFDQSTAPQKLSDWRFMFNDGKTLTLNASLVPYDLNSALFSDYAFKLRAVYVPPGRQITYKADGTFDFPIGSAIVKTFYYPKASGTDAAYVAVARRSQNEQGSSIDLSANVLIETRVLVLQSSGTWSGLPYVWDADQREATLKVGGKDVKLELVSADGTSEKFSYAVPNAQACQQCHSTQTAGGTGILPIGPKARNLNKTYAYGSEPDQNQLSHWADRQILGGFPGVAGAPVNADWRDTTQSLEARSKAYLDVNCAHCHSPLGAAFQSGLMLDFATVATVSPSPVRWGVCKTPLAYGGPGAPYRYDIEAGKPEVSLLLYRLSHNMTGDVMPPISRKVNHSEGIDLINTWIREIALQACE